MCEKNLCVLLQKNMFSFCFDDGKIQNQNLSSPEPKAHR